MNSFEYRSPSTMDEVISTLATRQGKSVILAGGTDLLPMIREGALHPDEVIDIKRLDFLYGIQENGKGEIDIGAAVTVHELESDPLVLQHFPALATAAATLGSYPVRCRATIGGNICHASPSADLVPPLLIYEAYVHLLGPKGKRTLGLDEFATSPGETELLPSEILTRITVQIPPQESRSTYLKYSPRKAMDLAIVGVAASIDRQVSEGSTIKIALGAVAPKVFRASLAEQAWKDRGPMPLDEIGELAAQQCSPIDDIRASGDYRLKLVRVLVARAIQELANS